MLFHSQNFYFGIIFELSVVEISLSGRFWFYPLQNENILSPIRYNITPPPPSRQQLLSEVHPMEMQYVELGYSKLASLIFGLISSHCVL